MTSPEEILEFIHRRFPKKSNWLDGNCYYFALILKDRFGGRILYDVIDGHFITLIDKTKYDWNGIVVDMKDDYHYYVDWEKFDEYDKLQKQSVIDGCIK